MKNKKKEKKIIIIQIKFSAIIIIKIYNKNIEKIFKKIKKFNNKIAIFLLFNILK